MSTERPTLAGVRVVSLAVNLPGPVAAAELVRMGAEVVKVEPPSGDPLARASRAWYEALARRQERIVLDLGKPEGRDRLEERLARSDLLLTASRPASLARLGLGRRQVEIRHPDLSRVAIVGHVGEEADRPVHDLTAQAEAGLVRPPEAPRSLIADLAVARRAVAVALALLLRRERGWGAGYAEVSLAEEARHFAAPLRRGLTTPEGPLGGARPGYGLYRARDGWVALAALERRFRERLEKELGWDGETRDSLRTIFGERDAAEWERWGIARDVPLVAVRDRSGRLLRTD